MKRKMLITSHHSLTESYHSFERLPSEIIVQALVTYSVNPDCPPHIRWLMTAGVPIICKRKRSSFI